MIEIKKIILGELATNCYLVIDSVTGECLIIDPADDANHISEKILKEKLIPKAIIATHGHFDHLLASGELQAAFQIPFLIHQKDEKLMKMIVKNAKFWLKHEIVTLPIKVSAYLSEDSKIDFGQEKLEVMHLPGHTPGSIALVSRQNKIAFVGDLISEYGLGRTDFSYGDSKKLEESLKRLYQAMAGYTLYPGHGDQIHL